MCNQNSCFGGNSCCWIIIAIILLFLFCGNGCGCNNSCGGSNGGCGCGCGRFIAHKPLPRPTAGELRRVIVPAPCPVEIIPI